MVLIYCTEMTEVTLRRVTVKMIYTHTIDIPLQTEESKHWISSGLQWL